MTAPVQGVLAISPAGAATATMEIAPYQPVSVTIAPVGQACLTAVDADPASQPQVIASPAPPLVLLPPDLQRFPPQPLVLP